MLRVGLTGGIATGKSYVLARFEALGADTIDADVLAREVVAPGTSGLAAVVDRFGPDVLGAAGDLDRARLAEIVFAEADARRDLEAIIHPRVYRAIDRWFEALAARHPEGVGIADIPLLFETGHAGDFDVVVVASCTPVRQLERIRARDGSTEEAARRRIAAQWPITEKVRQADYVIDTEESFAHTDRQVAAAYVALRRRAARN